MNKATLELLKLKIALAYYTNATDVQSWGMQELVDRGGIARKALGFAEFHADDCAWPNGYSKPSEYNEATGEWSEPGEYVSGEGCTCGLEAQIDSAQLQWITEIP